MKPLVLLQARSSSNRLPYKAVMLIKKLPSIVFLCKRILSEKYRTFVLTSVSINDEFLSNTLKKNNIKFFRGDHHNVKKRILEFTKKLNKNCTIIRITGDNLLINSSLVNECIKIFNNQKNMYMYLDHKKSNLPYGISVEIFKLQLLREKNYNSKNSEEHVTSDFPREENYFSLTNNFTKKISSFRCTLDYLDDYIFLKNFLKKYPKNASWKTLTANLKKYKINKKNNFYFLVKKTNYLSKLEIDKIIKLKKTFWKQGCISQKLFFFSSYKAKDIHFMLYNKSRLIGYNCLKFCVTRNDKFILLDSFIVSPAYKKTGISNILLAKSLNKICLLKTNSFLYANRKSFSLYKSFGWKIISKTHLLPKKKNRILMRFSI